MTFSDHINEKQILNKKIKIEESSFNTDPKDIPALKTGSPRSGIGVGKGKFDKFFGKRAHKKSLFSPKKRVKRSNTDVALGRRKRKGSKTKNARAILSNKHGIKKASAKDQNAEFFMDHLQVASLMKKFGYDWEQNDGEWSNKKNRAKSTPSKKRKTASFPGTDYEKISDFGKNEKGKVAIKNTNDNNFEPDEFTVNRDGKEMSVSEKDLTNFTMIGAGGIEYDITEEDLMSYEARFIIGLIHGGKSSMHFEEVEESEENSDIEENKSVTVITIEPIIDRDIILDKIEDLGYEYYPQIDEWRIDGDFPFNDADEKEDKTSIIGRTYLASLGHFEVFDFDSEDNPVSVSKKEVTKMLNDFGFIWNNESSTWRKKDLNPDETH